MSDQALQSIPNYNVMEVVKIGLGASPTATAVTVGAGWATATQTNTYAHGLGYKPTVEGYMFDTNYYYPLNYSRTTANTGVVTNFLAISVKIFTDINNVYVQSNITVNTSGSGGTTVTGIDVKYFLKRPPAN